MSVLKKKQIAAALTKKGFEDRNGDHKFFYYVYNGKKINIFTYLSNGSGNEIGDSLISRMSKELKLEKASFMELIECTLSGDAYKEILLEGKYIN